MRNILNKSLENDKEKTDETKCKRRKKPREVSPSFRVSFSLKYQPVSGKAVELLRSQAGLTDMWDQREKLKLRAFPGKQVPGQASPTLGPKPLGWNHEGH